MNFVIYPYSYVEFKVLWAKLNYFVGLAYPSYEKVKGGGDRMTLAPMLKGESLADAGYIGKGINIEAIKEGFPLYFKDLRE